MANTHDIGDKVRLRGAFTDVAGTAVDPTGGVTLLVRDPAGIVTSYLFGGGETRAGSCSAWTGTGV